MQNKKRIDAPVRLIEKLKPVQAQIERMQAEIQAALFGAAVALDVPDGWQWDGSGWSEPATSVALGESQPATSQSN